MTYHHQITLIDFWNCPKCTRTRFQFFAFTLKATLRPLHVNIRIHKIFIVNWISLLFLSSVSFFCVSPACFTFWTLNSSGNTIQSTAALNEFGRPYAVFTLCTGFNLICFFLFSFRHFFKVSAKKVAKCLGEFRIRSICFDVHFYSIRFLYKKLHFKQVSYDFSTKVSILSRFLTFFLQKASFLASSLQNHPLRQQNITFHLNLTLNASSSQNITKDTKSWYKTDGGSGQYVPISAKMYPLSFVRHSKWPFSVFFAVFNSNLTFSCSLPLDTQRNENETKTLKHYLYLLFIKIKTWLFRFFPYASIPVVFSIFQTREKPSSLFCLYKIIINELVCSGARSITWVNTAMIFNVFQWRLFDYWYQREFLIAGSCLKGTFGVNEQLFSQEYEIFVVFDHGNP